MLSLSGPTVGAAGVVDVDVGEDDVFDRRPGGCRRTCRFWDCVGRRRALRMHVWGAGALLRGPCRAPRGMESSEVLDHHLPMAASSAFQG